VQHYKGYFTYREKIETIVKVYSHLVDKLRTKQAFRIPQLLTFPTEKKEKTVDETRKRASLY